MLKCPISQLEWELPELAGIFCFVLFCSQRLLIWPFFFSLVEQMHRFGKVTHAMSSSCLEQTLSHSFYVLPYPEDWYCLSVESL